MDHFPYTIPIPSTETEVPHTTMSSVLTPMMVPPRTNYMRIDPASHCTRNNNNNVDGSSLTMMEEKVCRICLQDDSSDDEDDNGTVHHNNPMIAPCQCRGTSKWVHRSCLDSWRVHQHSRAFSKCTECGFEYRMQVPHHLRDGATRRWNRCKFYAFVSRDVLLATLILQTLIALLAWMMYAMDSQQVLVLIFGHGCLVDNNNNNDATTSFWCNHTLSVYYLSGTLLLVILLGIVGSVVLCFNGCSFENSLLVLLSPMPYSSSSSSVAATRQGEAQVPLDSDPSCCQVCCGDCRGCNGAACGNCDCRCCHNGCHCSGCSGGDCKGDDGGSILLILLLIFAVIMAMIGLVLGVILTVIFCQRVVQRHIFLIQKKQLVEEFVVMDLSGYDVTDREALEAAMGYHGIVPLMVPSAPDQSIMSSLNDEDRDQLSKLGLMEKPTAKSTSLNEEDRDQLSKLGLMEKPSKTQ